jgi:hypothetical protein
MAYVSTINARKNRATSSKSNMAKQCVLVLKMAILVKYNVTKGRFRVIVHAYLLLLNFSTFNLFFGDRAIGTAILSYRLMKCVKHVYTGYPSLTPLFGSEKNGAIVMTNGTC